MQYYCITIDVYTSMHFYGITNAIDKVWARLFWKYCPLMFFQCTTLANNSCTHYRQ